MERDNFTCQHCGSKEKELQVHHKAYKKGLKPWEYPDDMLITLCSDCHEMETESSRALYQTFIELKNAFVAANLSADVLQGVLQKLVYAVSLQEEDGELDNDGLALITTASNGIQNLSDIFALKKLGIDGEELMHYAHPLLMEEYKKA